MATLAARLANNGTYYVTGSLDDFTLSSTASFYLRPRLPDANGNYASYIQGPYYISGTFPNTIPNFLYLLGQQTNFTFETWFYANSQSMNISANYGYQTPLLCSNLDYIAPTTNLTNYLSGYMFHIEGNGSNSYDKISFRFYGANTQTNTFNGNAMSVNFPTSLLLNKWYHIAITISNNNIRTSNVYMNAYLNGNFIGSNTSTWVLYNTPSPYYPLFPGYFTCNTPAYSNNSANDVYISNMIISSNIKYNSNFIPIISTPDQLKNDPTTIMAIAPVKNSFSNSTIAIFDSANTTNNSGNTAVWAHQDYVSLVGNSTSYINYNFGALPPVVTKLSNNGIHQVYGYFDEVSMTNSYNTSISLHYSNNSFTGAAYGNTQFPYIQVTGDPFAGYGTAGNIWTYEQWIYFDNALTTNYGGNLAFGNWVTNGWELQFTLSPTGITSNSVYFIAGTSTSYFNRGAIMNLNAGWNHIAVQKGTYAYSLDYYVNGVHTNANNAAVSVGATWNYSSSSNFNFYPLENSTSNYQDTFLGPIRIVGGYNVYPLSNFTPDYFSSIQPISTGGAVTTFLFAPNINDSNIYINKGNAVSNVPVISAYNSQFTKSSYIYSKSYSNTIISSNNLPVAKIYNNGVFAVKNVFDEVNHPV